MVVQRVKSKSLAEVRIGWRQIQEGFPKQHCRKIEEGEGESENFFTRDQLSSL